MKNLKLKELVGTEKQINWANDIRKVFVTALGQYQSDNWMTREAGRRTLSKLGFKDAEMGYGVEVQLKGLFPQLDVWAARKLLKKEQPEKYREIREKAKDIEKEFNLKRFNEVKKIVESETSAKFWIDHRMK